MERIWLCIIVIFSNADKDSKRRVQNKMNLFIFYAEPPICGFGRVVNDPKIRRALQTKTVSRQAIENQHVYI